MGKGRRELVLALESVRTQLAIAMAAETKSTPPPRREYYLETAERTRWFVKRLRQSDAGALQQRQDWIDALESLRGLPAQSRALRVCQLLREVMEKLEIDN